jgi:hypothetical protein
MQRPLRLRLSRRVLAALGLGACLSGCLGVDGGESAATGGAITDVDQSIVKRQSIGNCWLYATASWLESMELSATNSELNASESYWTYWHWYEQILDSELLEVSTGGSYYVASGIIRRRGVIPEADFIASESELEMSMRQHDALDRINAALKPGGELATDEAKADAGRVRASLDRAWDLSPEVREHMTQVFGRRFERDLLDKNDDGEELASTDGTPIMRARDVAARFSSGPGTEAEDKTLSDALDSWREVSYSTWSEEYARATQKRFQRALHDRQPVIVSWFVDFNALDDEGRFFAPPATPGRQGGHMTVMEDYQINDVPGFGSLLAGVLETRPEALEAALADGAKIEFIRVKNSWGSYREDRQFSTPGYHDLYMKYLNGPVKQCVEKDGTADPTQCWNTVPMQDVVLPPGY